MNSRKTWHTKIQLGSVVMLGFLPIVVLAIAFSSAPTAAASLAKPQTTTIVSATAPAGLVAPAQIFTVAINIDTDQVTRASSFALQFDPALIQCEAASEGSFYKDWAQSHGASTLVFPTGTCNNISGTLSDMGITLLGGTGGPTGTGTVANVRFHALGVGISPLTLTNVIVSDSCVPSCQPLTTTVSNGQVQVGNAPIPTPTVSVNAPTGTITWNQPFTASINISTSYVSRGASFALAFDPTRILCEAASEGNFYKDWAQGHGASTLVFPTPACNNISGTLSVMGVTLLGGSGGPTGTGTLATVRFRGIYPGQSPISLTTTVVSDNCDPVCGPLTVTLSNAQVQIGPAPVPTATLAVNPPTGPVKSGDVFTASINITSALVTRASSFALQFNPAVIHCEAASEGNYYQSWAQSNGASTLVAPSPACNNISGTLSVMGITVLGASGQGPTGTGILANVRFQAIAAGTSPITLSNVVVSNNCSPSCQSLPITLVNSQIQVKTEYFVYLPLVLK